MVKHERKIMSEEIAQEKYEEELYERDKKNQSLVRLLLVYTAVGASWTIAGTQYNESLASLVLDDYSRQDTGCGTSLEKSGAVDSVKERIAHECIESKTGRVALVWYGVSDMYAQQLAEDAEMAIPYSFSSMLMPEVVPVAISEAVKDRFVSLNPDACFERDSSRYLSKIADDMMDLSEFDEVVGISPFRDCGDGDGIAGVNGVEDSGRYSMIVDLSSEDGRRGDYNTRVFAHEYGHAKGLLHASRAGDGNFSLDAFNDCARSFNLEDIVKKEHAIEYGDNSNIMGSGEYGLSAPQMRELLIPEILLGEKEDPRTMITRDGVVYDRNTFNDIKPYAALKLKNPIELDMYDHGDQDRRVLAKATYDEIVVEPYFGFGDTDTSGAAVYLVDSNQMQTLAFGFVYENRTFQKPFELQAGNNTVSVAVSYEKIEIKDISSK